jgi:hypothetical protein
MPDAISIVGPVAASGMIYQVAVSVGIPADLAVPVAVCAALGASFALSRGERIEVNGRSLMTALAVYMFSLALGATVGPALALGGLALLPAAVIQHIPRGSVILASTLLTSAFGVSTLLPMAINWAESRTRGGGQ